MVWLKHLIRILDPFRSDIDLAILVRIARKSPSIETTISELQEMYNQIMDIPFGFDSVAGLLFQELTDKPPRKIGPPIDYIAKRQALKGSL
jgi:hypothetical protein